MVNTAAIPTKVLDSNGDRRWMCMHEKFLNQTKKREPEIVFIGDSIILQMGLTQIWEKLFVPLHCLNFGIGGDSCQHVLWRLENGTLDNITPKVIVVQVGTNNHDNTPEEIVQALVLIVTTIHRIQPQANVLLLGLLPRGQYPNPVREKITRINSLLAPALHDYSSFASLLCFDQSLFVSPSSGEISSDEMYDFLHLTSTGYNKYCEPILDALQTLLSEFLTQNDSVNS